MVDNQRVVVVGTLRLLHDIATEVAMAKKVESDDSPLTRLVAIDPHRSARTMLINGERGTGKTAVLVTLVQIFARASSGFDNNWLFEGASAGAAASSQGQSEHLEKNDSLERGDRVSPRVRRVRPPASDEERGAYRTEGRVLQSLAAVAWILPTPIIDLQPLPDSTHLLLHVASQIRRLVSLVDPDVAPWEERPSEAPKCAQAGEAFYQKAGKVWGRANDRRNRLSPEEHALELTDVERDRTELAASYRTFIDALLSDLGSHLRKGGRASGGERQVLLVVPIDDADMNPWRSGELLELVRWLYHPQVVFLLAGDETMFHRDLEAKVWGAVMDPIKHLPSSVAPDQIYSRHAINLLALDTLDKIIPPSHRLRLPRLGPAEIWRNATALRGLFESIQVGPTRLATWIEECHLQVALPAHLRPLLQLAPQLQALADPKLRQRQGALIARDIAAMLLSRKLTRSGLPHEIARLVSARDGGPLLSEEPLDAPELRFELDTSLTVKISGRRNPRSFGLRVVAANATLRATAAPRERPFAEFETARDVGARPVALLPDLCAAWMLHREMVAAHLGQPNPSVPRTPLVYGVADTLSNAPPHPWPVLAFRNYLELRRTLSEWSQFVEHEDPEERLLIAFVGRLLPDPRARLGTSSKSLEAAAAEVRIAAGRAWSRSAAGDAIALASPAHGLSAELAGRWLAALRRAFDAAWPAEVRRVEDALQPQSAQSGPPDHPWFAEFGGGPTSAGRRLVEAIQKRVLQPADVLGLAPSQETALSRLTGVSVATVDSLLEDARSVVNSYEWLLSTLWASLEDESTKPARAAGFSVNLAEDRLEVEPPTSPTVVAMADAVLHAQSFTIHRVGAAESEADIRFHDVFVPPGLRTLHELASDYAFDQRGVEPESPPAAYWPGFRRRERSGDLSLWPAPGYRTFTDAAILSDVWNATCDQLRTTRGVPQQSALDSLARSYCVAIASIARARSASVAGVGRLGPREWQELGLALADTRATVSTPRFERERAYLRWYPRWRVLAAPEYGLSLRAARAILSLGDGRISEDECATLKAERRSVLPEGQLLPRKATADHPWYQFVETGR